VSCCYAGVAVFRPRFENPCSDDDAWKHFTGKRISQKLLRNCVKFLSIIHDVLNIPHLEFLKQSSDEVELRGGETKYDSRKLNSYPSKVQ